jgi:SAM-dependent methyltransferase
MSELDLIRSELKRAGTIAFSNPIDYLFQPVSHDFAIDELGVELAKALTSNQIGALGADGVIKTLKWCFKLDQGIEPLFVFTDIPQGIGKWTDATARVFPWPDEALLIINYLKGLLDGVPLGGRVMDLCCGCGTIGLWLARARPDLRVVFVDFDVDALEQAKWNSVLNFGDITRFSFVGGDLFSNVDGKFDLIVADPPFFPTPFDEFSKLPDSGGLHCDRISKAILQQSSSFLNDSGRLAILSYSLGTGLPCSEGLRISRFVESLTGSFRHVDASTRLFRFEHRKIFAKNPLPLPFLAIRLGDIFRRECIWGLPYEQQCKRVDTFLNWLDNLSDEQLTHLHYVWGVFRKQS